MTDEPERSESGAPIYRHKPREKPFEAAHGDPEMLEKFDRHLERHLGPVETVLHEVVSDLVHIDVHLVKPSEKRPFWTLITTGMSDRPMKVPAGAEENRHAELLLSLPGDWPLTEKAFQDERHYWPVRWLKTLARLPHEYDTWLGEGHTVPNGDPAAPFAPDTKLCCMLMVPPLLVPEEFRQLTVNDDKTVRFLAAIPIYREEMEFKLRKGADPLLERFDRNGVTELLDPRRRNVCAKRFWLF